VVGEQHRLLRLPRRDRHGQAEAPDQAAQLQRQALPGGMLLPLQRVIQQQEGGLRRQRARQGHAALLRGREPGERRRLLPVEAERGQRARQMRRALARRQAAEEFGHDLLDAAAARQRLGRQEGAGAAPARRRPVEVVCLQQQPAGIGRG
jgi:hypothetical protein